VPEEIFSTFVEQGKITEAGTLTIRLGATQWPIISDIAVFVLKRDVKLQPTNQLGSPPPSSPITHFYAGCLSSRNPATVGQAPNMLTCILGGVVFFHWRNWEKFAHKNIPPHQL